MSNLTARPEAQEKHYLIARHECGGIFGAVVAHMASAETVALFRAEHPDHETLTERPDPADWCRCFDGPRRPPVERETDTPEARTLREIAALPVPQPGETWYHCDGEPVEVLAVWSDGVDTLVKYRWRTDRWDNARTLRSWYGYERPGVRRFQRERPARPDVETDPYPWDGSTRLRVATPNPDGWSVAGPVPVESVGPGRVSAPTSPPERHRRARLWMAEVLAEVDRCQAKHRPFASAHEALAVFEEEADELRHEVRHGTLERVREEAIQAAAMLVRLLVDHGGEPPNGGGGDE